MMKLQRVYLTDNSCLGREIQFHPFCKNTTWLYLRFDSPSMQVNVPSNFKWRTFDTKHTRFIIERMKFFQGNNHMYTGGMRYNLGRDK